jgi:methionine-gamma-lyase
LRERLPRLGITTTFVDDVSPEGYRAAITPQTRVLYVETPGNPTLAITDIAAIASLAHDHDALCVADNTFATPFCQRPLEHGVDVVVHSMTKFLGGHGDAIAGVALGRLALVDPIRESVIKGFGGALSPFNAFLVSRGLRTFALRMRQATSSAVELAEFLSKHPAVARVHHPSLPDHPGHAIAAKQMRAPVAMVSFELHGGMNAGKRLLESVMLISHAVSLGDVRSLITQPASSTASTMPVEDRRRAGITDGLIRLAVGIEDVEDLRADLEQALAAEARP